jgi:predicted HTH transcriptional regulator
MNGEIYPEVAGFKEGTTSQDAADKIEKSGRAATLRFKVLALMQRGFQGTSEDISEALGEQFLAIRPRISELKAQSLIVQTGQRKQMKTGGVGHVWMIAPRRFQADDRGQFALPV